MDLLDIAPVVGRGVAEADAGAPVGVLDGDTWRGAIPGGHRRRGPPSVTEDARGRAIHAIVGVGPTDRLALATAAAVLVALAVAGALVPAVRAGRIAPREVMSES